MSGGFQYALLAGGFRMTSELITLPQAIARQEGFFVQGSRAQRNNNPGNLNFEPWLSGFGAYLETTPAGETPRFAHFPSVVAGWSALCELLRRDYVGITLAAAIEKYAPQSDDNNDTTYIDAVSEWTGIAPTTITTAEMMVTP